MSAHVLAPISRSCCFAAGRSAPSLTFGPVPRPIRAAPQTGADTGPGRLPEPDEIVTFAELLLGRPDAAGETEQLRLLHEGARARLRATVAGHGPAGDRRMGIVSWLRYDDGWRSLTPVHRDGQAFVRVDPVPPTRLGTEVARLLRGVAGR